MATKAMTFEQMAKKYEPRIVAILQKVREALVEAGYRVGEPYCLDGDGPWWEMVLCPHKKEHKGADEGDIDISFKICDSQEYDGTRGGMNFMLDVVEYGGLIVGGLTPYNYSPEVWVSRKDREAIEERFQIMEEADVGDLVSLIQNHAAPNSL